MIAYSFWHSPAAGVPAPEYEAALAAFVRELAGSRIPGLRLCQSVRFDRLPWIAGRPAYQDWYELDDTSSLDDLEAGAVGAAMSAAHGTVARLAGPGSGGLFARRSGPPVHRPAAATECRIAWIDKPAGTPYNAFVPVVTAAAEPVGSVWQRRLSLGPAREFCIWLPPIAASGGRPGETSLPAGALVVEGTVVAAAVAP